MGAREPARVLLIEPIPVPLVPVSGIAEITPIGDGQVAVVYYQKVPNLCAGSDGLEYHVAARLQWGPVAVEQAREVWMAHLAGGGAASPLGVPGLRH